MNLGDFTEQADAYSRARPSYPRALLDRLLAHAGVRAGDPVADIAAGTGLSTRWLAGAGLRVTAIEPNASMRALAPRIDGVTWQEGTFEATGLSDASQRWVVAAQAFHWADPPRTLPEMRRVLMPGGHLTILWNNRQNQDDAVLAWTCEAMHRHVPQFDEEGYRADAWPSVLASTGDFGDVAYHDVRHVVPMDRERFLDLWRSHNRLNVLGGPQRVAAFLAELSDYLDANHVHVVDVPYLCRAWTARRR